MSGDGETASFRIASLRDEPHWRATVANRIWNAWWREEGVALEVVDERLAESLRSRTLPQTLVAAEGDTFLGTASVIECDMEERPQYAPWLAALWVDPAHRSKGVGAALVSATAREGLSHGAPMIYLCATPDNAPFYLSRGWKTLETGVSGLDILMLPA